MNIFRQAHGNLWNLGQEVVGSLSYTQTFPPVASSSFLKGAAHIRHPALETSRAHIVVRDTLKIILSFVRNWIRRTVDHLEFKDNVTQNTQTLLFSYKGK
jgi:hypothetical protein